MNTKSFFSTLAILSVVSGVCLIIINRFEPFKESALFSWSIWLFFISLTAGIFFAGKKLSDSKDINAYTRMILSFMMLKMFLCILFVLAYYKLANPESKAFLLPFFLIYLTFTIFEVVIMSRLGRNNMENGIKEI